MVSWDAILRDFLTVIPAAISMGVSFFAVSVAYKFLRRFVEGIGGESSSGGGSFGGSAGSSGYDPVDVEYTRSWYNGVSDDGYNSEVRRDSLTDEEADEIYREWDERGH